MTGTYDPTQTYTILTVVDGVSGTFDPDNVTSDFALLDPSPSYVGNDVLLTLTRNDLGFADTGGNAQPDRYCRRSRQPRPWQRSLRCRGTARHRDGALRQAKRDDVTNQSRAYISWISRRCVTGPAKSVLVTNPLRATAGD
jgi:hypothetical protein